MIKWDNYYLNYLLRKPYTVDSVVVLINSYDHLKIKFMAGQEKRRTGKVQSTMGGSNRSSGQRGFASMDEKKQREIASKGGKAAHQSGHAHEFTSEEARAAGRKGGESVSRNKDHMSEIGRQGGKH